jgi:hypothetical protein
MTLRLPLLEGPGYIAPNNRLQRTGISMPPIDNLRLAQLSPGR